MTQAPMMTDLTALTLRRNRLRKDALFLHETAADEIEDRMGTVNKSFSKVVIVTGFPDFWAVRFPEAQIIPDDEVLDLVPGSSDAVVHAMSLHWANDPVGQLIQCRRALKPDGLMLTASFGGQTLAELRAALGQAEVEMTGGMSPRIAPMADLRDMGALLQRAGLALPVADTVTQQVEYRDIWHLMQDLRAMGEANALALRLRRPTRAAVFRRAATLYHDSFSTGQGRIPATFELLFLTGWAPDASQPQPLRPGSATTRLSDALGTDETKLPN